MGDRLQYQGELSGSEALLTMTALVNADRIIHGKVSTVQCLFDLSALVDAVVLHHGIVIIQGVTPQGLDAQRVLDFLVDNGLLHLYRPSFSTRELISMMNQYSLFRDLSWYHFSWQLPGFSHRRQGVFEATELMDSFYAHPWPLDADGLLARASDTPADEHHIKEFLETPSRRTNRRLADLPTAYSLFDVVHVMTTGRSQSLRHHLFRTVVYLCSADWDKLTFYPDYVRLPYVASCSRRLYASLARGVYEVIARALGARVDEVLEEVPGTYLSVPPFLQMVLEKVVSGAPFFGALLEVRHQFEPTRIELGEIDHEIRSARSLDDKRRALDHKKRLLASVAGKFSSPPGLRLKELLSLSKHIVHAASNPLDPTAYNDYLLTRPYEWVRDWWLRRPVVHLMDAVARLERLPDVLGLVQRGLGCSLSREEIAAYREARNTVASLMIQTGR